MKQTPRNALILLMLSLALVLASPGQTGPTPSAYTQKIAESGGPAAKLYSRITGAGLDENKVFNVRDASVDRHQVHITLEDGTIAFTKDINGRVTGAFFEGDGEVLLVPPDQSDRASMMLFTGAAILEERFDTAYFRFNDDTYDQLRPFLRPIEEGAVFASKWNSTARNLAETDALRLLLTFTRSLPATNSAPQPQKPTADTIPEDRFLHARVQGKNLGPLDVYYDSLATDQIAVAQPKLAEGIVYYDTLAGFSLTDSRNRSGPVQNTDEIGIKKYAIRAEVGPPTQLRADADLEIEVRQTGGRALLFELSRYLAVSRVDAGGQSLEFIQNQALEGSQLARRGNDILAIVFPQPLQAGQKIDLHFTYGGDVLSEAGSGLLYVGARGTWYPNRGLAAADFDIDFRYPSGWILLATGKRTTSPAEENESAGEQHSRWTTERPIPVAGFNLGKYTKATAQASGATVETYAAVGVERAFPKVKEEVLDDSPGTVSPRRPVVVEQQPPSPARNARAVAETAARAIDFYSQRFGPFPYSSLELTQMPGGMSQGWPGLIFLSSFAFLTKEELGHLHVDTPNLLLDQQVTAHETAHQWWGDLVYWRSYRDQWMVEALANYCSMMMLESENPAGFHTVMEKYRRDLLRKNKSGAVLKDAGPVTLGLRLSSSQFPDGYEAISYGRGTWLFHMLRTMLRDSADSGSGGDSRRTPPDQEPFVVALRRVRQQYAGKPITTQELMQIFAEELPPSVRYEDKKSLDWFYEEWVNGTAIPHLELQGVKLTPAPNSVSVSGTILQKDAPKTLITSVPLYAVLAENRRVLLGRIFADGPEASFHIKAPIGTRRILVDPEHTVLSDAH